MSDVKATNQRVGFKDVECFFKIHKSLKAEKHSNSEIVAFSKFQYNTKQCITENSGWSTKIKGRNKQIKVSLNWLSSKKNRNQKMFIPW